MIARKNWHLWKLARSEIAYDISLEGHTETYYDQAARLREHWVPGRLVKGVAYDTPVLGSSVNTTYLLRLWKGVAAKIADETLTFIRVKVLSMGRISNHGTANNEVFMAFDGIGFAVNCSGLLWSSGKN